MTNATGWDLVAEQRILFAEMIEGLGDRVDEATLCDGWSVHHVAGHLLTFTNMSFPRLFGNMVKHRFKFDEMTDKIARRYASEKTLAEMAADLRTNAGKKSAIPGFPAEMPLSDVTIHRQDICRPLGLGCDIDEHVLRTVLDFLTTHKQAKNFIDTAKLDGVQLVATDIDWSYGSGDEIEGAAEAIMMTLAGRPAGSDLTGDAVSKIES